MPCFLSPSPLSSAAFASSPSPRRELSPGSRCGWKKGTCSCREDEFCVAVASPACSSGVWTFGSRSLRVSVCRRGGRVPSSVDASSSRLPEALDPRGVSAAKSGGSPSMAVFDLLSAEVQMPSLHQIPPNPGLADGAAEDGDEIRASSAENSAGRPAAMKGGGDAAPPIGGDRFRDLLRRRDGPLSISDFNEILLTAARHGEIDSAAHLLSDLASFGLAPNCWTFSIMIDHLCKENEPEMAKQFSEEMIKRGLSPTVASFTFLIHCLCKKGRLQSAYEIFAAMSKIGCRPTIQTYNCLLNGLCYVGRIEEALQLLQQIKLSPNLKPDIVTFTTVMDGFCKVGRTDEAIELLNEILDHCINPTVVTFNVLINGFCREGRPLEAAGLFNQMRTGDCPPDRITYSTLLQGLLRSGEIPAALKILAEMEESGIEVEARAMNSLLRGVCRQSASDSQLLNEAERIAAAISERGRQISPYTRCLVVRAFAQGGRPAEALAQLEEMERSGGGLISPKAAMAYNMAIRVFCGRGSGDDAVRALAGMVAAKRIPSSYACEKIIGEMNRRGRFLDACSVYAAALKRGVSLSQLPEKSRR